MAKYGKKAEKKVEEVMHEMHEGKLKSGGSGKKVTNPKQAIAIGLSEARKEGDKVPPEKSKSRSASKKSAPKKAAAKKSSSKKSAPKKSESKKSAPKKSTAKKSAAKKSSSKKSAPKKGAKESKKK
jgi:uncharacterized protein DUF6496